VAGIVSEGQGRANSRCAGQRRSGNGAQAGERRQSWAGRLQQRLSHWRERTARRLKVAGLLGLLLVAAGQGQAATPTHCAINEQVVFSCATDNKVVSVCASSDLALSYRFGPPGRPEISYPPPGESQSSVKAGRWVFAGGGGAWLA